MKKMLVVLAAMMMVIAMVSGAYAAKTTSVGVSATVGSSCQISGGAIAFGAVDAVADAAGKSATVTAPVINCTKGASVTVSDDKGANEAVSGAAPLRMKDGGTNYIEYSISYTASLTGAGMGVAHDIGGVGAGKLSLSSSFGSGALDAAPAGSYTDTIVLTVAP